MSDLIPYALGAAGQTVHISEVTRTGLACRCMCPICKTPLEAVNVENPQPLRRPHFRHYQVLPTSECGAGLSRLGIDRIIVSLRHVRVPRDVIGADHRAPSDDLALITKAVRLDDETVRIDLADGQQFLMVLTNRQRVRARDRALTIAMWRPSLGLDSLLSMPPDQAAAHLQADGLGEWFAPSTRDSLVSDLGGTLRPRRLSSAERAEVKTYARSGVPTKHFPLSPPVSWAYRWTEAANPADSKLLEKARWIMEARGLTVGQLDQIERDIAKRRLPGERADEALAAIAADVGIEAAIVRDFAQHAGRITG